MSGGLASGGPADLTSSDGDAENLRPTGIGPDKSIDLADDFALNDKVYRLGAGFGDRHIARWMIHCPSIATGFQFLHPKMGVLVVDHNVQRPTREVAELGFSVPVITQRTNGARHSQSGRPFAPRRLGVSRVRVTGTGSRVMEGVGCSFQ